MGNREDEKGAEISIQQILTSLPHRYPFLLVDRILSLDLENQFIVGRKNVTINEEFFQGHFPGEPIMPGVLILEALAQVGGVLMFHKGFTQIKVLMSMRDVRFRHIVTPGDTIDLEAKALHLSKRGAKIQGKAKVEGKIVAEAEIMFGLLPSSKK